MLGSDYPFARYYTRTLSPKYLAQVILLSFQVISLSGSIDRIEHDHRLAGRPLAVSGLLVNSESVLANPEGLRLPCDYTHFM